MFGTYLKRVLKSPVFILCVIVTVVVMVMGCYTDLSVSKNNVTPVLYCIIITHTFGISHMLIPILTVMPFLFFYVEEIEKKVVYYQLIRSNKKAYYMGQILTALISAGLVACLSMVIFTFVCMIYGAGWQVDNSIKEYFIGTFFEKMINNGNVIAVYLIHCLAILCFSLPWTLVSMVVSLYSKNRFVIISSSFISYMAISYLTQMASLEKLDPGLTLLKGKMKSEPGGGIYHTLLYHFILISVLSAIYFIVSKRRFTNEGI